MSTKELYTKGARVWIPHPETVWVGAVLLEDFKGQKTLKIEYEEEGEYTVQSKYATFRQLALKKKAEQTSEISVTEKTLPPLRNPEILIGENDLTSLSYLHEPAVLYNLQVRFCDRNDIYTYCGIVLVAINPYEELDIYGNDIIQAYHGQDMGAMDPHIYAVAEEAFKRMVQFDQNQSVIVSGESGAGKTVSAKYAMRYFAAVGGSHTDETQVEKKVLASNPIMEAIGNAKTTRNDNSSRFGKYLEIGFKKNHHITSAHMRTYLLEKSRVVFQAPEERNYHIFYQLCASSELPEFEKFQLDHQDNFYYTFQGCNPTVDGIDDAEEMLNTREAMTLLGISEKQQMMIFQILSAILHFGNVNITEDEDGENAIIKKGDKSLQTMCDLLGIDEEQTRKWLCNRKITTVGETLITPLDTKKACFSRDALAKHIYAKLFDWIVKMLNITLSISTGKQTNFIGVLDIYGFETFEINSFEQFCINYANEKLQQQFTLHVFKLEQEEYVKEEIEWSFIDFYDNQPCIDLIESKLGILDLLDEECKMPKGSDESWCRKLYQRHLKAKHFEKPRMSETAFVIIHFADSVEYQSGGFLEKNRDTVLDEQLNILKASEHELVADLFQEEEQRKPRSGSTSAAKVNIRAGTQQPKGSKSHKKTVGSQFRDSLNKLMDTLFSTNPHYIRCIKPNDMKQAFTFEPQRAVQQLRACGVLETIRISSAGYPSRWSYPEFYERYRVLSVKKDIVKKDKKQTCRNILSKLIQDPDKFQFGKSKIFFRAGQVAYLEKLRSDKLYACGIMIQKHIRGWLWRRKYQKIRRSVLLVQTYGRGMLARRHALHLRRTAAATRMQKVWRGYKVRKAYLRTRQAVITIQKYARGMAGRQEFRAVLRDHKAVIIQSHIRGWLAKRRYRKVMRGIILIQSHYRRRKARAMLKILKVEARSVQHIKKVNLGLENKIIEMQHKLDEKNKEIGLLREDQVLLRDMQNQMAQLKNMESNSKTYLSRIAELEQTVAMLEAQLEQEKGEKQDLITEKQLKAKEHEEVVGRLIEENLKLKEEVNQLNLKNKQQEQVADDVARAKLEEANQQLKRELDEEREHHQKLVKEYNRLLQRCENLQGEVTDLTSPQRDLLQLGHRRNLSNLSGISLESEMTSASEKEKDESELAEKAMNGVQPGEEDQGYGTERKKEDTGVRESIEAVHWNQTTETVASKNKDSSQLLSPSSAEGKKKERSASRNSMDEKKDAEKVDVGLMIKLQTRVKDLEKERARLQELLDEDQQERPRAGSKLGMLGDEAYEAIKNQELEVENTKMKEELQRLRAAVAMNSKFEESVDLSRRGSNVAGKEFMDQFEAMADELERRREECIQLRALLVNRSRDQSSVAKENYEGDVDRLNEDGELAMAYKTQKELLKMQEEQIDKLQNKYRKMEKELRHELTELKQDNDRQQKLIGQLNRVASNLSLSPEAKIEACMQHEITRLTSENLDLREQIEKQQQQIHRLKKALKLYAKRLKTGDVAQGSTQAIAGEELVGADIMAEVEKEIAKENPDFERSTSVASVRHREREYMGMLEYRKEDEPLLIKNLIQELSPKVAGSCLPGLPAYVFFMCIRHTDYINDDEKVRSLLTNVINGIKRVVKKRHEDVESVTMWLANTCRLLHNFKQYSGDKAFQTENTPKQNEHCLRNFDLSEYRQVLSDLAVWIYQTLTKLLQDNLQPMIVHGLLEHEAIAGLTGSKPTGMRGRSTSNARQLDDFTKSLDMVMKALGTFLKIFKTHALDPELVKQVFKQLYYYVCAVALNNLLLRKDLSNWSKGMQIRYNISHIEQWLRDQHLQDCGAAEQLEPIIQASQLLQARKTEADVESICDMCSALSVPQIVKLLNLYTPVDEFEERVPIAFIRKIQEQLKKTRQANQAGNLLMDTKKMFPVTFPFNPSNLGLETIQVPETLNVNFLKKL
ncbi:unconventional myosin-Va-like [Lingula anatina]|uniref:Unconventional myosin-Va-like n=1 Tax=Lingula anatina TaxID=7574 RepID=A0A1S3JMP1_LINAN|nr:unconventional myosin-Va-like [Lingula anatina]|eukprot:XP_013411638.1 unconventional myosin-Va-like [Lingula anatina]